MSFINLLKMINLLSLPKYIIEIEIPKHIDDAKDFNSFLRAIHNKHNKSKYNVPDWLINYKANQFCKRVSVYKNTDTFILIEYTRTPNGKKHGSYVKKYRYTYCTENIIYIIFVSCNFVWGMLHGRYEHYFYNGNLFIEANYKNGKLDGNYKKYNKNGDVYIEKNYRDGKLHGHYEKWNKDGTKCIIKKFIDNKLIISQSFEFKDDELIQL
jgi:hypothetical protein